MNPENQSIFAILVVLLAISYLTHRWWKNRHRASQGCGGAGQCACPSTKLSNKSAS